MEFYMRILQKKRHQAIYTSMTAKTSADLVKLSSCHFVIFISECRFFWSIE